MKSNNVYKNLCWQCDATYVGETSRHFYTRIAEREGISRRINRPYSKSPNFNIYKHFLDTDHKIE